MLRGRSGVYAIELLATGDCYVGSAKSLMVRWRGHQRLLDEGTHHTPLLQAAWTKHGRGAFAFRVIELCEPDQLLAREQVYLDTLNPAFNVCRIAGSRRGSPQPESWRAMMRALQRARSQATTHCPRGHVYDADNTHVGRSGKRQCRACNALRVAAVYSTETTEQRQRRMATNKAYYERGGDAESRRRYLETHREEKRAYDKAHRAKATARWREARARMSPEKKAAFLERKRESYMRHREKSLPKFRARYRRVMDAKKLESAA